jgi:hypothetical protein
VNGTLAQTKESNGLALDYWLWAHFGTPQLLGGGRPGDFLGDGWLNYQPERVFEAYYSFNAFAETWITLDGQYIMNPGYNTDRGSVKFLACRFHFEY